MRVSQIKENFIYNMIGTVSGFLFPMITFPYVSRVIMAEGIGQVQFYNSIINYVILLTSLGIPLYATREIARVRDNIADLSRTTAEIISLNLILNILGYAAIFIMCFTIDEVKQNIVETLNGETTPEEVVEYLYQKGIVISEIKVDKVGLEEYYIDLMEEGVR